MDRISLKGCRHILQVHRHVRRCDRFSWDVFHVDHQYLDGSNKLIYSYSKITVNKPAKMTYQAGHPVVIAEKAALEGTEKGGLTGAV